MDHRIGSGVLDDLVNADILGFGLSDDAQSFRALIRQSFGKSNTCESRYCNWAGRIVTQDRALPGHGRPDLFLHLKIATQ